MSNAQSTVTEEIRVLMARRRVTQEQIGQALGMKQGTFSKRMTARKEWSVGELEAIAAYFDVPITDLFGPADLRKQQSAWMTSADELIRL